MTGAFLILAVTVAIGIILWGWERWRTPRHGHSLHHHNKENRVQDSDNQNPETRETGEESHEAAAPAVCCGLHAICERTGQVNEPPVYYDDEELDRFAGRPADSYNDEETEEFRDVLLTLLPSDVPGWSISLEKRRINLPETLRPELELMLMEQ